MYTPTAERPEDADAIEILLDLAFGPGRQTKISYRYRDGVPPVADLGFVVRDPLDPTPGGRLYGTIRYWPIRLETPEGATEAPALLLGPLAVRPELRGAGVGRALMHHSLRQAAAGGHGLVLLVGDLDYYSRFGFAPAAPLGFVMPDEQPHRLLFRETIPGTLARLPRPLLLRPARIRTAPAEFSVTSAAPLC